MAHLKLTMTLFTSHFIFVGQSLCFIFCEDWVQISLEINFPEWGMGGWVGEMKANSASACAWAELGNIQYIRGLFAFNEIMINNLLPHTLAYGIDLSTSFSHEIILS